MSEPAIDIEHLRRITKKAQKPILKRQEEQKNEQALKIEEDAKRIAAEVIQKIPSLLEQEARNGFDHAQVMGEIRSEAEKKAAQIVSDYCRNQGLTVDYLHCIGSSEFAPHDYIIVRWETKS